MSKITNENNVLKATVHGTIVCTISNGIARLNSGGWRTATTKRWINKALNGKAKVYQKDFEWFVKVGWQTIPFKDNIEIYIG